MKFDQLPVESSGVLVVQLRKELGAPGTEKPERAAVDCWAAGRSRAGGKRADLCDRNTNLLGAIEQDADFGALVDDTIELRLSTRCLVRVLSYGVGSVGGEGPSMRGWRTEDPPVMLIEIMSKRARDRSVKAGARALRKKPGWDPSAFAKASPSEQLRDLAQSERTEESYREAAVCEACQAEQRATGDATALCPHHLSEAMGL